MSDCTKKTRNLNNFCNCTYPCERKGKCCECLAYHRAAGELPACYFDTEGEKTYDRSFENYQRHKNNRG